VVCFGLAWSRFETFLPFLKSESDEPPHDFQILARLSHKPTTQQPHHTHTHTHTGAHAVIPLCQPRRPPLAVGGDIRERGPRCLCVLAVAPLHMRPHTRARRHTLTEKNARFGV
jgi:hypothetical protein